MRAFPTTSVLYIGFASLMLACGGSTSSEPGTGGSAGTSGMPDAAGGSAGAGGRGGSGGSAGGGSGTSAIALFSSQVPASQNQNAWLDTGEQLEPTTLIIAVSTAELSCAAPRFDNRVGNAYGLVIAGLPEALQKAGTYEHASKDVIAWESTWLSDGMGNGGGGARPLQKGTVEVLSIDADFVEVRFTGLDDVATVLEPARKATRCK
jgi:hypothetical protein